MRFVLFYHSLYSDWNHGNAHFLRGVATELLSRGHSVGIYEEHDNWSLRNLVAERGGSAVAAFQAAYPGLDSVKYKLESLDLHEALDKADVVLAHEWNPPALVERIGLHHRRTDSYVLLFHDTHHRSVSDPAAMARYSLTNYDGVLAFGRAIRDVYLARGWARQAWTWHEAADTRIFRPSRDVQQDGDVVWIGNWGDDERTQALHEYLLGPVAKLKLCCAIHGVRYPDEALAALAKAGIRYGGYLPNFEVPRLFAKYRFTVHIPRHLYTSRLKGIPTIRPFEAMATGTPLICTPWDDSEHLFSPGKDYLVARDGNEMLRHMQALLDDPDLADDMAEHARQTILARHTCAHRVTELLDICRDLKA